MIIQKNILRKART